MERCSKLFLVIWTGFSVAFSPDGQTLASASKDRTIKLWDLRNGLLRTLSGHSDAVRTVAISPDGQTLASGSWDKTIKVWNLHNGDYYALYLDTQTWFLLSLSAPMGRP